MIHTRSACYADRSWRVRDGSSVRGTHVKIVRARRTCLQPAKLGFILVDLSATSIHAQHDAHAPAGASASAQHSSLQD
jgi:hypothetical protein